MSLLDDAWAQREDEIYPMLFEDLGVGISPLTAELFEQQFGCDTPDARWLHHGVFRCPPVESRDTWLYVTSGMSNPWDATEADEFSGLGTEFLIETRQDETWAIPLLQSLMAFNLLLDAGHYGDRPALGLGDRIPQPIAPNLSSLILWAPTHCADAFELVSGHVDLVQVMGITAHELDYAQQHGSAALCSRLTEQGIYPVTEASRPDIHLD